MTRLTLAIAAVLTLAACVPYDQGQTYTPPVYSPQVYAPPPPVYSQPMATPNLGDTYYPQGGGRVYHPTTPPALRY